MELLDVSFGNVNVVADVLSTRRGTTLRRLLAMLHSQTSTELLEKTAEDFRGIELAGPAVL